MRLLSHVFHGARTRIGAERGREWTRAGEEAQAGARGAAEARGATVRRGLQDDSDVRVRRGDSEEGEARLRPARLPSSRRWGPDMRAWLRLCVKNGEEVSACAPGSGFVGRIDAR